jgi:hypothetical protein
MIWFNMKFSYILSAFPATLSTASPIDEHRAQVANRHVQEVAQPRSSYVLSTRDVPNDDKPDYIAASKGHTPLVNGKYY